MSLTVYKHYSYREIENLVKKKSGRKVDDWAGSSNNSVTGKPYTDEDYKTGNYVEAIWARENGYNWAVLSHGNSKEEIDLRVEIRNKYEEFIEQNPELNPELPYQNFWHYAIENIFYDPSNGCMRYFNPSEHLAQISNKDLGEDNFVKEVLEIFIQVFKENNLPDEIEVEISW